MRFGRFGLWFYRLSSTVRSRPVVRKRSAALMIVFVSAVLICLLLLTLGLQSRMRPQVEVLAGAKAHYLASQAINEAVLESIADLTYDDLIHLEKDSSGRIIALKTDMVMINRMKSVIHQAVLAKIEGLAKNDILIPVGNLMDSDLLAGRGPSLRVRLVPVGTADVVFGNQFTTAGINQTRHQVLMTITTEIGMLLPGGSATRLVSTEVCIAETIIVGAVPDAYAELEKSPVFN